MVILHATSKGAKRPRSVRGQPMLLPVVALVPRPFSVGDTRCTNCFRLGLSWPADSNEPSYRCLRSPFNRQSVGLPLTEANMPKTQCDTFTPPPGTELDQRVLEAQRVQERLEREREEKRR